MYYLSGSHKDEAKIAKHWRINTGIKQGDTESTVEINLALALRAREDVEDIAFTTVWGQGHTEAERSGDSSTNFIAWVKAVNAGTLQP